MKRPSSLNYRHFRSFFRSKHLNMIHTNYVLKYTRKKQYTTKKKIKKEVKKKNE